MNANYLEAIVLYCLRQFRLERSKAAIFHLLKGKKSAQTIQDSFLFDLPNFFGICPQLQKLSFEKILHRLESQSWIQRITDEFYQITDNGEQLLKTVLAEKPIPPALNGMIYNEIGYIFWLRLSLFVQTISHLVYNNSKFLPITNSDKLKQFVKSYIFQLNMPKQTLGKETYAELEQLLGKMGEKEALLVFNRFPGYQKKGVTFEQLAIALDEDSFYLRLVFQSAVLQMMQYLRNDPNQFNVLSGLLKGLSKHYPLTASAEKTFDLLKKGLSIEEIALARRLKRNTIEDHIVEIALNVPHFHFEQFMKQEDLQKIRETIIKLKTNKLKSVKEFLKNEYTYFQIRLAMASMRRQT